MKKKTGIVLSVFLVFAMVGCVQKVPQFEGNAKVVGGRLACEKICRELDMTLAGMVVLGEYTNGCICQVRDESASMNRIREEFIVSAAGAVGTAPAIETWLRERQRESMSFVGPVYTPIVIGPLF